MRTPPEVGAEQVGYGRPKRSSRFQKGRSGNPRGRPRNRRREIPYDHVLGQMVTVLEDGKERRITAAEAFIMQLTRKGLQGDSASARASLAAIEAARASRIDHDHLRIVRVILTGSGLCCVVEHLGMAVRRNRRSEENVRLELKPWIVQAALSRLGERQLTPDEQRIVVEAMRNPEKVDWPLWWSVRK
jgi:hypothetical protein